MESCGKILWYKPEPYSNTSQVLFSRLFNDFTAAFWSPVFFFVNTSGCSEHTATKNFNRKMNALIRKTNRKICFQKD
jgi:hypothetical protein